MPLPLTPFSTIVFATLIVVVVVVIFAGLYFFLLFFNFGLLAGW